MSQTSPPEQPQPPRSGILASNVDVVEESTVTRRSRSRWPIAVLLIALGAIVGAGAVLLVTAVQQPARPAPQVAAASSPTSSLSAPTPGVGATRAAGGALPAVNGISCDALESTVYHIHIHLAVFIDGQEQQVPLGIGIGQPWQVVDMGAGPFVDDGACFYWMHTHTDDGVIHIEAPIRRTFTLGDFFAIWQEQLSPSQVGPFTGDVIVYVNGQRDGTNPADIRLTSHQRIQLNIGMDVPPYYFEFAPGD